MDVFPEALDLRFEQVLAHWVHLSKLTAQKMKDFMVNMNETEVFYEFVHIY